MRNMTAQASTVLLTGHGQPLQQNRTRVRTKSANCTLDRKNFRARWLQKQRHRLGRNACALAGIQHASSGGRSGRFAAEILAERSNNEAEVQFPDNLLPQFCLLAYRACQRSHVHELFCHGDCRQRVNVLVEGGEDSEFGVVYILGRAEAVCIECRVEVGDVGEVAARQPRLDMFARQDKARQWDDLTQRRRIEVIGVARCIGKRGLLAHQGGEHASSPSVWARGFASGCLHALRGGRWQA